MDLFVLDFQKQFDRHLKEWMRKNREKYPKAEQMEAQVEKVYEHWLATPAVWLEGATPLTYFDRYDDPEVLVHDPANRSLAAMLILMPTEGYPIALGVIYENPAPTFEGAVIEQNQSAAAGKTPDLQALVAKGQTWQVEKEPHQI